MNELTVAQIDTHVGGQLAGVPAVEEHQIAGLQLSLGHGGAVAHLSRGGAVNGVTVLLAHISNKTGAVKAAGAAAAVHVGVAHKLLGIGGNGGTLGRAVGHAGIHQSHIIGAHIAVGDLIPAAQTTDGVQNLHHGALAEGAAGGIVGAGAGADIQRIGNHLTINLFSYYAEIISGDISGHTQIGDLVPLTVAGGADHIHLSTAGQYRQHRRSGVGLSAKIQTGITGHSADIRGQSRGNQGGDHQHSGGQLCSQGFGQMHRNTPPFLFRKLDFNLRRAITCRSAPVPARQKPHPWRRTGCPFHSS